MVSINEKLSTLLLKKADVEKGESYTLRTRYKQFRASLLVAIALITLLPATAISILGYFQYMSRLEKQDVHQIRWHLNDSREKIEAIIDKELKENNQLPDPKILQQLARANTPRIDIFLLDDHGVLVSPSPSLDDGGEKLPLDILDHKERVFAEKKTWKSGVTLYGYAPLAQTSWFIVLVKEGPLSKDEWLKFQSRLLLTFFICFGLSLFVIFELVYLLTSRIRESDANRMALLSEAEHSNKLASVGRLAAGVAHEINNPLAVIDQKAGLIEDLLEFSDDFSHKEKVELSLLGIHDGVQRCKVITHRLLGFARKMDAQVEPVDLNVLLVEVIGFLEKEAIHHQIALDLHLAEDLPQIESDIGQLQQIFLNIINNAIDAIGLDGIVSVESRELDAKHVQVIVTDNGPGMSAEILKHIFDPFFTTKNTNQGTGLGLSITYGLVKRLGGDIEVDSEPDAGTRFTVTLPVHHKAVKGDLNV